MRRSRKRWTQGRVWSEAPDARVAEVIAVEESLGATFLTLRTSDAREWSYIADAGAFAVGDRVRITLTYAAITEVVPA